MICKRRKSRSGQLHATPQVSLPRANGVHLFHPTTQLSHRAASVRAHVAELHQRITPVGGQAVGGHSKAVSSEKWRKTVRTLRGTSVGQRAARSHGGAACAAKSLHDPCSRVQLGDWIALLHKLLGAATKVTRCRQLRTGKPCSHTHARLTNLRLHRGFVTAQVLT